MGTGKVGDHLLLRGGCNVRVLWCMVIRFVILLFCSFCITLCSIIYFRQCKLQTFNIQLSVIASEIQDSAQDVNCLVRGDPDPGPWI